jgi:monoterpene epsilon-lactone hydrolase
MTVSTLEEAIAWEQRFAAANAEAGAKGLEEARATNAGFMAERAGELPADLTVEAVDAGGVPARWITRGEGSGPVIFFLHSGGMVVGASADSYEWLGRITAATGGRALGVDFRLAPESAWPSQLEDSLAAYAWMLGQGVEAADVVVMGESGGGALATATLIALRDGAGPLPAAAVLTSPLVDFALTGDSLDANEPSDPFVKRVALEMMMQALLQGQDAAAASPLNADLAGLPPLLVQVGTVEAVFDDGRRFAEKAGAAGGEVEFEAWEDMIHLWHGFPDLPQAQEATAKIADFIGRKTGC